MTSQLPNLTDLQQTQQAIADFEQSSAPSVWSSLDKQQVIADMLNLCLDSLNPKRNSNQV